MIIALLILIAGTILQILSGILGTFNYIIPVQIQTSLAWIFHIPLYFQGLLPISTLLSAFLFYLVAWLLVYGVKLVIMGLNIIPGVHIGLPKHSTHGINKYGGVGNKPYGPVKPK